MCEVGLSPHSARVRSFHRTASVASTAPCTWGRGSGPEGHIGYTRIYVVYFAPSTFQWTVTTAFLWLPGGRWLCFAFGAEIVPTYRSCGKGQRLLHSTLSQPPDCTGASPLQGHGLELDFLARGALAAMWSRCVSFPSYGCRRAAAGNFVRRASDGYGMPPSCGP